MDKQRRVSKKNHVLIKPSAQKRHINKALTGLFYGWSFNLKNKV
jgi:hypothetical protein